MRNLSIHVTRLPVIAAVLAEKDAELERSVGKSRALKHGMMQEPFTGGARLVPVLP